MKTLITTLTLCLATSLFADGKEAELKKRIAGYDVNIASARKELSDLYAKQGALRKDYLALKRKQIEAKKAEIAKRRPALEAKRKGVGNKKPVAKKPATKKPISKGKYLKLAAIKKKAAAGAAKKKAGQKGPYTYKKIPGSPKATAELMRAKKEYLAAQARLKKTIEAYNASQKASAGKMK